MHGQLACGDCVLFLHPNPSKACAMPEDHAIPQSRASGLPQGLILLWSFLFVVWLVINSSVEPPIVGVGALVSLVVAVIFMRRGDVWRIKVTPSKIFHFIAYTGVFLVELVKANVNMLRYVYAPRIDIRPGIVKVRMPLKSPIGRLALANSIALTPGSLVMDLRGDALFIHWLDVKTTDPEGAARMIIGPFERHLGVVFG
ncbi:multicomponent Na+:H+ antiporter subunit E [Rhizobium tibeticum]|uniref:Multicomponent Na+:H+ antiporter subunit E n=2 Tax=Rhizobium tibeticum TaxID=501024 RepID=A0A1H8PUI2_9HYPH|nr:Multiple resistance and pH homeostasis protein E [Rhizobium tibeticum]SEO45398.1 multicomponent Na+:H+ antiporter subunit E [Rhizobium tibeticum]